MSGHKIGDRVVDPRKPRGEIPEGTRWGVAVRRADNGRPVVWRLESTEPQEPPDLPGLEGVPLTTEKPVTPGGREREWEPFVVHSLPRGDRD